MGSWILTYLFNKTENPKAPPSEWKIPVVGLYSINKENWNRKGPGKYRGLSSQSVLGKILQRIVDGELRDWLSGHKVLPAFKEHSLKGKTRWDDTFRLKSGADRYQSGGGGGIKKSNILVLCSVEGKPTLKKLGVKCEEQGWVKTERAV